MAMATVPQLANEAAPAHFPGGPSQDTPSKRVHKSSNGVPPMAKRQRSFPSPTQEILLTPLPTNGTDATAKAPLQSPVTTAMRLSEHTRRRSSSPHLLKSSLKPSSSSGSGVGSAQGVAASLASGLGSPSESDKRAMYFDYVQNALLDKARGRDAGYDELVAQFSLPSRTTATAPPPIGLLQMLLHALTGVASKLDRRNHTALVNAILVLPWATMGGDTFARTWTRFVCTLCSARGEWVTEVLSRAINGLSYRSDWRSMAYAPATSINKPTRRLIYSRIHALLRALLSLIPSLPTQMPQLILQSFPHKSEGIREHIVYAQNIFELCEYAEELRPTVLEFVIARGLEIDVEIQIELDELEDAEADFDDDAGSDIEVEMAKPSNGSTADELLDKPLDDDSDSDDDDDSDDGVGLANLDSDGEEDFDDFVRGTKSASERERIGQVRKLVDKLDAIMSALFSHIEQIDTRYATASRGLDGSVSVAPPLAITMRNEQFGNLLRIFQRSLLPTFKSRHVQFLLFWLTSLERSFSDQFLSMLLRMAVYANDEKSAGDVFVQGSPTVMRVAASSYIASLVSRAKFIDGKDARIVMFNLCAFLTAHLDAYDPKVVGELAFVTAHDSDALGGQHAVFYAVAQACFYIFCFRWRDLRSRTDGEDEGDEEDEDENGEEGTFRWCNGLEAIKRAILSPLNPLGHCSATVVQQFARVAQLTGFTYCWSVMERNNRNGLRRRDSQGSTTTQTPSQLSRTNSTGSLPMSTDISPAKRRSGSAISTPSASTPDEQVPIGRPEIESFFPFDPYRLRSSTKWIEPIYREWSDVAPQGMLDDDSDEEDDDADEFDDDEDSDDDNDSDDDVDEALGERSHGTAKAGARSAAKARSRTGLTIPSSRNNHKPARPSKLSNTLVAPHSFGASVSTDASSSVAQSLEAMSISPRFV